MTREPSGVTGRAATPRRRGRPRRPPEGEEAVPAARERILHSARAEFAERGYDKASIRAIARGAEVDPALVHHYFGSKEGLFSAAIAQAAQPALRGLSAAQDHDLDEFGERFTRAFFGIWENPVTRGPLLAIVRSAVSNETAARAFRAFAASHLVPRLAGRLPGPDERLRAETAAAQLIGTMMLRHVIKVEPMASADPEELIRRLAPVIQHHLTGAPLR